MNGNYRRKGPRAYTTTVALGLCLTAVLFAQDTSLRVSVRYDFRTRIDNLTQVEWTECTIAYGSSKATIGTLYVKGAIQVEDREFTPPISAKPDPAKAVVVCKRDGKEVTATLGPPPVTTSLPTAPVGAEAIIRADCEKRWPTNFQMQAFCVDEQRKAATALQQRQMTTSDQQTIRTECRSRWADNFQMRNFCEEEQLKALATLGR